MNHFNFWDIIILIVYFIGIIWWALYNRKSSDSTSYFLAGRKSTWPVIGLSLFAASISSSTLIGQSGDAYSTGIAVFNYNLISVIVMIVFAWFFLPFYIRLGIFTMPEFLERRFDSRSRYYFSLVTLIGNIFLDAAGALYAAALIIQMFFPGLSLHVIILIFALVVASYTIPGGLSSAISAEIIQAAILIGGSILLTYLADIEGGREYILHLLETDDKAMNLVRPLDDASVPWLGLIVGIPILGFYFWGNNQTLVQRALSAESVDQGRKGVLLVGLFTVITLFIIVLPGVMAQDLFPGIDNPDKVYPKLVVELMPAGLMGVMIAALVAALTSTLSAILNSASTLVTMDFYQKFKGDATSKELVRVGQITAAIILVVAVLWAPFIREFDSLLKYYQEMLSYIAPPIVAAFFLGIFSRRTNGHGVFSGLITGLAIAVFLLFFRDEVFGSLHFLLVIPFLFGACVAVMLTVSYLTAAPAKEKIENHTWSISIFTEETKEMKGLPLYRNYRFWSVLLFIFCIVVLYLFR